MASETISGVHVWLVLMKATNAVAASVMPRLRAGGLGDSDFRVLEALLHKGPMPVNTLGPKVFLTPGSISTAVDRLLERGLVSRTGSTTDRRVQIVDLSGKGRSLISTIFEAHAKHLEDLAQVLTPGERRHLVDALKKLGKRAQSDATRRASASSTDGASR